VVADEGLDVAAVPAELLEIRLLGDRPNLRFHTVDIEDLNAPAGVAGLLRDLGCAHWKPETELPGRENASPDEIFDAKHRRDVQTMIDRHPFDPEALAEAYIASGRRIGKPG